MWIAAAGFAILIILVFMRVWVGMALIAVGFIGLWILKDFSFASNVLSNEPFTQATRYTLTMMPLFSVMGALIQTTDMGSGLYNWAKSLIGHIRGGLGMATIVASGVFAAICGNSQITAMTIGKISYPEMRKAGYSDWAAAGGIAAGGGIGIMIPPSVGFIVYGLITEQSIGKLFMAGMIPGIIQVIAFSFVYYLISRFSPKSAPASEKATWAERLKSTSKIWSIVLLMILMLGGIYGGFFTATEAGAMGALGTILIAFFTRQLDRKTLYRALVDGARMTATVMILLIGANVFLRFITVSRLTVFITEFVIGLDVSRYVIILLIVLLYMVLGSVFDIMAAILLTVPFLYPIVTSLGFHPIWFGVFVVAMMQIGELTPPIGLTCFVLADACELPVHRVFKGVFPFLAASAVVVAILIIFPQLALLLQ